MRIVPIPPRKTAAVKAKAESMLIVHGQMGEGGKFCVGLVAAHGIVTRAAPLLRYMQGWTEEKVRGYALLRGWKVDRE